MPYHRFKDENGYEYGSFETFEVTPEESESATKADPDNPVFPEPGWYWWPCFPGCIPDGDPMGPFASEKDALFDVKERDEDARS